ARLRSIPTAFVPTFISASAWAGSRRWRRRAARARSCAAGARATGKGASIMAKVSVIILTYGERANLLQGALRSVQRQSYQDFEIVVVDDGSRGRTAEIVRHLGDPRIRYLRHPANRGEAAARNTGLKNSSGEYVAFLDDDDEWLPSKLEKQAALLDSSPERVGLVYTGFWRIHGCTRDVLGRWIPDKRGNVYPAMCSEIWIRTPSTVLVRRRCLE